MTEEFAIVGARLVAPSGVIESGTLIVRQGRIACLGDSKRVEIPPGMRRISGTGRTVLPGFIDVHIHGGGGADTMDATPDALRTICRTHARFGTTSLLTTTMTQSGPKIAAALENARAACEAGAEFCPDGAQVLGIHLEGPYISPKRPGAQPEQFVRDYDAVEFASWLDTAGDALKLITLAPERPGASELIAACRQRRIVISVGHTDATAEEARAAIVAGASHATHLFNAMPPLHHRNPGAAVALLTDDRVKTEIIADGHHVAPDMIRLALMTKDEGDVVLITDAIAGAGVGDGVYELGGNEVRVSDGRATLADGTLAGSVLTMQQAARNIMDWFPFIGWNRLAKLTSGNAASQMGWHHKGTLTAGADADLVVMDDDLQVHATYVLGRCVYPTQSADAMEVG